MISANRTNPLRARQGATIECSRYGGIFYSTMRELLRIGLESKIPLCIIIGVFYPNCAHGSSDDN